MGSGGLPVGGGGGSGRGALDADGYYNRGMMNYNQKDYMNAIRDFSQAIKLHPKTAEYYKWRAFAYSDIEEYKKAVADYSEVIRLEPKTAMHYFNRGLSYNLNGDFESAVSDFTQALKIVPDDADYLFNRAIAYGNNGEYELAVADMEIAKSKYPKEFTQPDSLLTVYKAALAGGRGGGKKSALDYEYGTFGQRSAVYFYRGGGKINDAVLRVFDSQNNLVKRINISDNEQKSQNRREVGTWDLTNMNGKPVRYGSYSVKGTISTRDGRNEELSLSVDIGQ